jgi:hypothetical protein
MFLLESGQFGLALVGCSFGLENGPAALARWKTTNRMLQTHFAQLTLLLGDVGSEFLDVTFQRREIRLLRFELLGRLLELGNHGWR